ncbi:hypothetical protein AAG906_004766 [Vitis piasezkii]
MIQDHGMENQDYVQKKKNGKSKENGHLYGMKTKGKSKGMTEADSDQGDPNADSFSYACILIRTRIRIVHVTLSAELIDPALKGTINVLRSCSKVPSIKRVVVTSSLASVLFTGEPLTPEVLIDESWFSDPVLCKELIKDDKPYVPAFQVSQEKSKKLGYSLHCAGGA